MERVQQVAGDIKSFLFFLRYKEDYGKFLMKRHFLFQIENDFKCKHLMNAV